MIGTTAEEVPSIPEWSSGRLGLILDEQCHDRTVMSSVNEGGIIYRIYRLSLSERERVV